jgi:hypothetical protein
VHVFAERLHQHKGWGVVVVKGVPTGPKERIIHTGAHHNAVCRLSIDCQGLHQGAAPGGRTTYGSKPTSHTETRRLGRGWWKLCASEGAANEIRVSCQNSPSSYSIVLSRGSKRGVALGGWGNFYIALSPTCILLQKYPLLGPFFFQLHCFPAPKYIQCKPNPYKTELTYFATRP